MNSLFPHASLKRSTRTRTRKGSISVNADTVCSTSHSSILASRKSRPPPLQIIPELSEVELDIDVSPSYSPTTARPTRFSSEQLQLDTSRLTLSAFSFSIDDALLMFGDDAPRSPALSASSSTSGASSEDVLATPGASDDENADFILLTPRRRPRHISVRPLCINKTRSLIYNEDDEIHNSSDEKAFTFSFAEAQPEASEHAAETIVTDDTVQDFYAREFEDFISLSPIVPSHYSAARRDSLTLTAEVLSVVIEVIEPLPRGRSRLSKPLPLLPPATPPASIPSISPLVHTTARTSLIRRKRNAPSLPNYPPPPSPPSESRPLPRMSVPLDVEDSAFPEEIFALSTRESIGEQVQDAEDVSTYSCPSLSCSLSTSFPLPSPAMPERSLDRMYGEVVLPRSSTDSDAPRSSIDSTSSLASSSSLNLLNSPTFFQPSSFFEDDESEATACLRSRWSSSTLGSLAAEPSRTGTLLSPLKNAFGSRVRRVPPQKVPPQMPLQRTPPKLPKKKGSPSLAPSPPRIFKHRRQQSQSSTSSAGTSSSEHECHDGSPTGLQRKPIPMLMFLRAT